MLKNNILPIKKFKLNLSFYRTGDEQYGIVFSR